MPTDNGERSVSDFARELAKKLEPYLATGITAGDIADVIIAAMLEEMRVTREKRRPAGWA